MALRSTPTREEQFQERIKKLSNDVRRLQHGPTGEVCMGSRIHLGALVLDVQEGPGGKLILQAWNEASPDAPVTIVIV